jgi:hypothetical protein
MKILFHSNQIGLRGTEIALYDYAAANENILGNSSLVAYHAGNRANNIQAIEKFSKRFQLLPYDAFSDIDAIIEREHIDRFYTIKYGNRDGLLARACPNLVHAVFPNKKRERHGEFYAFVSEWLSKQCSRGTIDFVPHIVALPAPRRSLRAELGISPNSLVVGGYGGADCFDVPFALKALQAALSRRSDLVAIFMNFTPFMPHERVIFLPGTADLQAKADFISSCDAMLHARRLGESFGLACGEFSILNKPVIAFSGSPQRSHIEILGEKLLAYADERQLFDLLIGLERSWIAQRDWDCYSKSFNTETVMHKFASVFLHDKPFSQNWFKRLMGGAS